MDFTAFREMKPLSQFMFSLFVIIASFLFLLVVSMLIAIPVFGLDSMLTLPTVDLENPTSITVLKYFQVVQSIAIFVLPPFILGWLFSGHIAQYLLLNKTVSILSVILVFVLSFTVSPLINFIGEINSQMQLPNWLSGLEEWMRNTEDKATELTEAFLKVDSLWGLFFNIFMVALLPALGEELLFRGVIQRIFTNWTRSANWGIWISAILFSALHMQFYGFIPRLFLGVLFGYLLVWSGSIWLPIIAHFLNNCIAVVGMYLIDKKMLAPDIEELGSTNESYYMAVVSLILTGILIWLIQHEYSQMKTKNKDFDVSPGI